MVAKPLGKQPTSSLKGTREVILKFISRKWIVRDDRKLMDLTLSKF